MSACRLTSNIFMPSHYFLGVEDRSTISVPREIDKNYDFHGGPPPYGSMKRSVVPGRVDSKSRDDRKTP